MNTATLSRDPFMPQAPKVRGRAIALAVAAHVLLVLGLMFSVNWGSEEPATVAAELWSATPQAAAPRAVEPPPPEVKQVEPVVKPTPKPPEPVVAAKPPAPALPDPQIAIEKAKKEDAKRVTAEQEALKKQKREKAEREKEELAQKKLEKDKVDKLKAEQVKAELAKNEKADKAEAAQRAAARDSYLKRMQQGLPGATGGATDTGTALRSSGPSEAYGGRIAARIKPNIVFTDPIDGNPRAEVELRLAPDGSIAGRRLVKSSGVKAWDDAVLRAIDRTETFPLDNGRVPPPIVIGFRPRD